MAEWQPAAGPHVNAVLWPLNDPKPTIEEVRAVAPEAFIRNGVLYIPHNSRPYNNNEVFFNQYIFRNVGDPQERVFVEYKDYFEGLYAPVPVTP